MGRRPELQSGSKCNAGTQQELAAVRHCWGGLQQWGMLLYCTAVEARRSRKQQVLHEFGWAWLPHHWWAITRRQRHNHLDSENNQQ